MKYSKPILAGCLAFIITLTAQAQIADLPALKKNLHTYLSLITAKNGFRGEVLVAQDGNILFREATGWASVENKIKMMTGATYRVASITKTFTGTLIALAQEEKKLNVHDKAHKYIKNLSPAFKEITIHQLLTHTSGLPHNEGIADYWKTKSKLELNTEQVISEINKLTLLFPPGSQMKYSSLGYYLLGTILENVYNDTFPHILETKILQKLKMSETGAAATGSVPGLAAGYHLVSDDSLVVAPYRSYAMVKGAGDMYTTAADLLKWNQSFLSNTLLRPKTKDLVFMPYQATSISSGRNYGYGWFMPQDKPEKYFHGGGTWGYSSYIALYPESKISLIIVSNVSVLPTEAFAADIEKIVFNLPFTMPIMEQAISPDSINTQIYNGHYMSDGGKMRLTIFPNQKSLFAQLAGNPPFQIYPKGNHRFFGKKLEIQLHFTLDKGIITGLTAERMGQTFNFKKL